MVQEGKVYAEIHMDARPLSSLKLRLVIPRDQEQVRFLPRSNASRNDENAEALRTLRTPRYRPHSNVEASVLAQYQSDDNCHRPRHLLTDGRTIHKESYDSDRPETEFGLDSAPVGRDRTS